MPSDTAQSKAALADTRPGPFPAKTEFAGLVEPVKDIGALDDELVRQAEQTIQGGLEDTFDLEGDFLSQDELARLMVPEVVVVGDDGDLPGVQATAVVAASAAASVPADPAPASPVGPVAEASEPELEPEPLRLAASAPAAEESPPPLVRPAATEPESLAVGATQSAEQDAQAVASPSADAAVVLAGEAIDEHLAPPLPAPAVASTESALAEAVVPPTSDQSGDAADATPPPVEPSPAGGTNSDLPELAPPPVRPDYATLSVGLTSWKRVVLRVALLLDRPFWMLSPRLKNILGIAGAACCMAGLTVWFLAA